MSEEDVTLYELLNLSIGAPHKAAVNFSALHALLHAVLEQLDIRDMKTRWGGAPPGDADALVGVTDLQDRLESLPSPTSTGPAADNRGSLRSFIQPCEEPSAAMELMQELHNQHDTLKEEVKELHNQHDTLKEEVKELHNQQDTLKEEVKELHNQHDTLKEEAKELHNQQDTLKEEVKELHNQHDTLKEEVKELHNQQEMVAAQAVEECCHRVDDLEETVTSVSDTLQKFPDPQELSQWVTWARLQSGPLTDGPNPRQEINDAATPFSSNTPASHATSHQTSSPSSPSSPRPADHTGSPAAPGSPSTAGQISNKESPSVRSKTPQQTPPVLLSQRGSERHLEVAEAPRNIGKLKQEFNKLEARVTALERGKVEPTPRREHITDKGSQDASNDLTDQLNQQKTLMQNLMSDQEKGVQLVDGVQTAMLQLRADCDKLQDSCRFLQEDGRQTQSHIEELFKVTEELQEKKADKQMVESGMRADKCALDSKVSRLQFDSVTEQLSAMFHELLNKVSGQEQDWSKVIDKLSTEMECKLNRIELDSVKKQLEGRWKYIHEKLQAQGAPELEDAAALRKQLVDRFHCLSCDRPVKYTSGPHLVKVAPTPGFPAHKSMRPCTVYALEHFRQHYRSERISELTDYSHPTVSRSCGGSHTVTSAAQRRTGLQSVKQHTQPEQDGATPSEEVDIIGLDGHIYKGRLNAPALRNTETKLPTISTKDGLYKTKDKTKSHKSASTPEPPLHHPHSAKSTQCSRSASCSSGRDWPVSALGCTSQSSVTPASVAADASTEPLDL